MVSTIFGFGGRIGRLRYFLLSLILGVLLTVLIFIVTVTMIPRYTAADGSLPAELPTPIILAALLIVGPPSLWFSLALQAKRIRDIGWNPPVVIGGWIALLFADRVVSHLIGEGDGTLLGALLNLGMVGVLLFWPGRDPAEDWTPPTFGSASRAPEQPSLTPVRRAVQPAPAATTGFGRRGVL